MEDQKEKTHSKHDWADTILNVVVSATNTMGRSFVENIQNKIDNVVRMVMRSLLSLVLSIIGLLFLMIGLAQGISEYFNVGTAIGYIAVGAAAVLIAILVNNAKRE